MCILRTSFPISYWSLLNSYNLSPLRKINSLDASNKIYVVYQLLTIILTCRSAFFRRPFWWYSFYSNNAVLEIVSRRSYSFGFSGDPRVAQAQSGCWSWTRNHQVFPNTRILCSRDSVEVDRWIPTVIGNLWMKRR